MSIYLVASSDKSLEYYPQNASYKFSSHLKAPLILNGKWKVAIVETFISSSFAKKDILYISSNVCDTSIIEGHQQSFLRRFPATSSGHWSATFHTPYYMNVKLCEIYDIEIDIKTKSGEYATFLDETSSVTLHFKAFPFFY